MSGGGGTNTTVQQSSIPPNFLNAYDSAVTAAQNVASTPYNPYPGPMVAGFTQPQSQAFGQIQNLQGVAQPYLNAASNDFNSATQPLLPGIPTVDRGTLQGLAPSALDLNSASTQNFGAVPQYSGAAVQGFENPYTSQVVNATEQQFANTNAQQQQQVIGNAIGQGAWGGDRSAVAQAVLAGQQQAAQAPVIAGLENQGFSQAQGEFNTQQQLAEQQAAQKSQLQQSAAQQQLGLLSGQQQTELGANEANAWLASQAGFGQANLGNEALTTGLTASNALEGVGALGQQQAQELLNVPFEQYTAQQAYPFQTTGWEANIAEGLGSSAGGNSSTTSPSPSVLSQVGGLGAAGVGALGQSGAFGSQGWLSGLFGSGSGGASGLSSADLTAISNSALADEGISGAAAAAGNFGVKRGGRITPRPGFAAGGDVALSVNSTKIPVPGNFGSSIFGQFTGLTPQITVNGTSLLPQFAGVAVPQATTPTAAAPTTPAVPTGGMTDGGVGFGGEAGGLGGLGGVGSGLAGGTTGAGVGAATGAGAASPGLSGSLGGGFTGSQTAGGPNIGGTLGGGLGGLAGSMVGGAAGPIGSLAGGFAGHKGGQMLGNAFGNALGLGNHTDFSYGPDDLANNAAVAGPSPGFAADLMGMGTSDPSGYGGGISSGAAAADPNSPDATNADVGIGNGAGTGFGGAGDGSGGAGGGSDQGPGAGGAEDGGGTGAGGFSKRGGRIRRFDDGGDVGGGDDVGIGSTPTGLAPQSAINAGSAPGGGGFGGNAGAGDKPSPWTSLMAAGFGMMAGRSPFAAQNIGAGALEGLKEYQNERKLQQSGQGITARANLEQSQADATRQNTEHMRIVNQALAHLSDAQGEVGVPSSNRVSSDYSGSQSVKPTPTMFAPMVAQAAKDNGVPLDVANFIFSQESGWNPMAVGPQTKTGRAQGIAQLMPDTAKELGANPLNPSEAIPASMKYLRQLYDKTGSWENAISSYGTFSTGKGDQADQAVRQRFRQYAGNEPQPAAQGAPYQEASLTPTAGPQGNSGAAAPPVPALFNVPSLYKQAQRLMSIPDKGMIEVGQKLLEVAQKQGNNGTYLGTDGQIHASPGYAESQASIEEQKSAAAARGKAPYDAATSLLHNAGMPRVVSPGQVVTTGLGELPPGARKFIQQTTGMDVSGGQQPSPGSADANQPTSQGPSQTFRPMPSPMPGIPNPTATPPDVAPGPGVLGTPTIVHNPDGSITPSLSPANQSMQHKIGDYIATAPKKIDDLREAQSRLLSMQDEIQQNAKAPGFAQTGWGGETRTNIANALNTTAGMLGLQPVIDQAAIANNVAFNKNSATSAMALARTMSGGRVALGQDTMAARGTPNLQNPVYANLMVNNLLLQENQRQSERERYVYGQVTTNNADPVSAAEQFDRTNPPWKYVPAALGASYAQYNPQSATYLRQHPDDAASIKYIDQQYGEGVAEAIISGAAK